MRTANAAINRRVRERRFTLPGRPVTTPRYQSRVVGDE